MVLPRVCVLAPPAPFPLHVRLSVRLDPAAAATVPITGLLLLLLLLLLPLLFVLLLRWRRGRVIPASSRGEGLTGAAALLVRHCFRDLVVTRKERLTLVFHPKVQRELRRALQPERPRPRPSLIRRGGVGLAAVASFTCATATLVALGFSPVLEKL